MATSLTGPALGVEGVDGGAGAAAAAADEGHLDGVVLGGMDRRGWRRRPGPSRRRRRPPSSGLRGGTGHFSRWNSRSSPLGVVGPEKRVGIIYRYTELRRESISNLGKNAGTWPRARNRAAPGACREFLDRRRSGGEYEAAPLYPSKETPFMSEREYLFPCKLTRRDFLWTAGAAGPRPRAAGGRRPGRRAEEGAVDPRQRQGHLHPRRRLGQAARRDEIRLRLRPRRRFAGPRLRHLALGQPVRRHLRQGRQAPRNLEQGVRRGRRLSRTEQVAATAHGLYWNKEGDTEYLYWTENVATPKDSPKIGARVYKTDLKGKVLYTVGNVEKESATSQKFDFTNPTDVAVAANGDIYVVDGYGSQLLHRFDKNFKLIKTIGGPGKEHGKFNTCHGVWINTLKKEPELYIADRANNRVEIYSLEHGVQADAARLPHAVLLLSARGPALRARTGRAGDDPRRRRQGRGPAGRRNRRQAGGRSRTTPTSSPRRTP